MSQQLEMTIVARDQASRVVGQVQKKVLDFGKDIGTSIAAVAGPMAIATMAFQKISAHFAEMARLRKEAFDWGASLSDSAAKLGVTVEQFQGLEAAADRTGVSVDKVAEAFKSAAERIAEAQRGNVDAIASLKALGFTAEEIKDLKPEDVLKRLGSALSTVQDPAKRAELAMAALGTSAKGLQDVLAKGFDIAGAMLDTEGLSGEEQRLLKETDRLKRAEANKEKVKKAKEQAGELFFGKLIKEEMEGGPQSKDRKDFDKFVQDEFLSKEQAGGAGGKLTDEQTNRAVTAFLSRKKVPEAVISTPQTTASVAGLQGKIDKDKADAEAAKAKEAADKERAANVERLAKKQEARNKKEAEDFAKQVEKENERFGKEKEDKGKSSSGPTVSSLREIGGGIAGESIGDVADIAKQQLDTQKQMLEKLDGILKYQAPPTNSFIQANTKNIGVA